MDADTLDAAVKRHPKTERRLHHITRIDIHPSDEHPDRHPTHGWQVRVRRDGERMSKFFADAKHDGRDGALEAAFAYRNELLAELPTEPTKPRQAWSNTGVVGLSLREKTTGPRPKLYVQLNWINAEGKRKAGSYSVEKWGIRRALWNGCLKLYRERKAAGYPVDEPQDMFAQAQEPFQDMILAEIEAEKEEKREAALAEAQARRTERNRERFEQKHGDAMREEDKVRRLEDVLFG